MEYNMVPKIIGFGISRCFDEKQCRVITSKVTGSMGYDLLEVFLSGIITFRSDIYNLSLYINNHGDIDGDEEILKIWRNRLDWTDHWKADNWNKYEYAPSDGVH